MTAIIGLLADTDHKAQTGNILICADELITYSLNGIPVSSNRHGGKLYDLPCGFYVAIADDISRSHQVVSFLYDRMGKLGITPGHPSTADLIRLALADTANYVRLWIRKEICADYGVSEGEFLHDQNLNERENIRADLKAAVIATELIIGGFGKNDSPVLFYTDCINIEEQTSPGFFCGGSGATAALNWLNFRGQNCFMSTQRSFYHLREAHAFARLSRAVGNTTVAILLTPGNLAKPITADEDSFLKGWTKEFYPKETLPLDSQDKRDEFASSLGIKLPPARSGKTYR
ncbi:MAG: hypothetical protein LAN18_03045 [Acidobacteriia bacterium]|nr:hypothetical protein [Terriglobia bacterium]